MGGWVGGCTYLQARGAEVGEVEGLGHFDHGLEFLALPGCGVHVVAGWVGGWVDDMC